MIGVSLFMLIFIICLWESVSVDNVMHPYGVKVFTIGESVLRQTARTVSIDEIKSDPDVLRAKKDSFEALTNFRRIMGYGRAIAAPQVGHSIRLVTTTYHGHPEYLFNPSITYRSPETFSMWDDCLSLPNMMACVKRNKCISVKFLDANGMEQHWEKCSQDLSELLQHELDHLDGVLAVDRLNYDLVAKHGQSPLVTRDDWLKNKEQYNRFVDFTY